MVLVVGGGGEERGEGAAEGGGGAVVGEGAGGLSRGARLAVDGGAGCHGDEREASEGLRVVEIVGVRARKDAVCCLSSSSLSLSPSMLPDCRRSE